jgi:hypothetical protein
MNPDRAFDVKTDSIYLIQLKCRENHAQVGLRFWCRADEEAEWRRYAEQDVWKQYDALIEALGVEPKCQICQCPRSMFTTDLGKTIFETLEEANTVMLLMELGEQAEGARQRALRRGANG